MAIRAKVALPVLVVMFTQLLPVTNAAGATLCDGWTPTLTGTEGDDNLVGSPGDDIIVGLGGNDTVDGMGGNDHLCGGPGNDMLTTVAGEHPSSIFLDAGLGQDNVLVALGSSSTDPSPQGTGPVLINVAAEGGDTVTVEAKPPGGTVGEPALLSESIDGVGLSVELVNEIDAIQRDAVLTSWGGILRVESALDIAMNGLDYPGTHRMDLDEFQAILNGSPMPGPIRIFGGAGADSIFGTPMNDEISGGGGNDRLDGRGGTGNELDGGAGRDRCGRGDFFDGMFGNCELRLDGSPLGGPIRAELEPPKTFYGVTFAQDTGGTKFNYDWSATTISCGRFIRITGQPPNTMQWIHPQGKLPRRCPHRSASHRGKIKVTVEGLTGNSMWIVRCTYSGSLPGEGPSCVHVS